MTIRNGSTSKIVRMSPVNLLSNGFFTPTGQYPERVIQAALWQAVTKDKNFANIRGNANWNEALSVIQFDQATRSYFLREVSSSKFNHNMESEAHYLTSFRDDIFNSHCSSTPKNRGVQRSHIRKLFDIESDGTFDLVSTTLWNTKSWNHLYNPENELPYEPILDNISSTG